MVAAHHLASDCKYASVHRMLMATQPSMLPARMATIRYVPDMWNRDGEEGGGGGGGRGGGGGGGGGGEWLVVTGRGRENEQSKMQPLRVFL